MTKARVRKALVAVGTVGVVVALLQVPPAWLGIPEFRGWIGWRQTPNPPQTQLPQSPNDTVKKPDTAEKKRDTPASRPIDGPWGSSTSGNVYYFVSQDSGHFNIYLEDGVTGRTQVGSGTRNMQVISASLVVISKNRTATLHLTLSEDGQTMEGTFTGADAREKGYLAFHRLSNGLST